MAWQFLVDFVGILNETRQLLCSKKKKLIFSVLFFTLFIKSVVSLAAFFSFKPLIADLYLKIISISGTSPSSHEFFYLLGALQTDLRFIIGLEWVFVIIIFFTSLFILIATVIVSAMTYLQTKIPIKNLVLKTLKSWKRPFVTCFFIFLFNLGFIFFLLLFSFSSLAIFAQNLQALRSVLNIVIIILAMVFNSYLGVFFNLAAVVSVLEDKAGFEALGKGAAIVKGMVLPGFLLNLIYGVLGLCMWKILNLTGVPKSTLIQILIGLVVVNLLEVLKMFLHMAYTVIYSQRKKTLGEEIQLAGDNIDEQILAYTSVPFIAQDVP